MTVHRYPPVAAGAPMPVIYRFHCSACGSELPDAAGAAHVCPVYPFGHTAAGVPQGSFTLLAAP
jgi:hypothetical protein